MFEGLVLTSDKPIKLVDAISIDSPDLPAVVHFSKAVLVSTSGGRKTVYVHEAGCPKKAICILESNRLDQQDLDLFFEYNGEVSHEFSVEGGKAEVHLTGYIDFPPRGESEEDDDDDSDDEMTAAMVDNTAVTTDEETNTNDGATAAASAEDDDDEEPEATAAATADESDDDEAEETAATGKDDDDSDDSEADDDDENEEDDEDESDDEDVKAPAAPAPKKGSAAATTAASKKAAPVVAKKPVVTLPAATESKKRKASEASTSSVQPPSSKKAKETPSKETAAPTPATAYEKNLVQFLKANGKTPIGILGTKVKRPAEIKAKLSQFIKERQSIFSLSNNEVSLKQ